jgi:hypothetical protein
VMDSILGMALQLPALKTIGDQIGVDFSSAVDVSAAKKPAADPPGSSAGGPSPPERH